MREGSGAQHCKETEHAVTDKTTSHPRLQKIVDGVTNSTPVRPQAMDRKKPLQECLTPPKAQGLLSDIYTRVSEP